MGDTEKKVYEGYKRTSSSSQSAKTKSASPKVLAVAKKTISTKKTTSKSTNAKPVSKIVASKPRIAMFIDVDNAGISRENLLEILFYANGKYKIEICKLYGFSDTTLPGIRDIANEYNVITVGKMKFKQPNVNCLDSRLLIDAYECALNNKNKIDTIFLWCYPCDLADLFEKIIALGINTAIINNNIFDCKNKFVSQTFKLYSPYNLEFSQSTYGKVKNESSNSLTNKTENTQTSITELKTDNQEVVNQEHTTMIDGVIPPVLPRRSIPERSNTTSLNPKPKQTESQPEIINESESKTEIEPVTENKFESEDAHKEKSEEIQESVTEETDVAPKSLVEEIARKLNLQIPSNEELEAQANNTENISSTNSSIFMDMLKQAGLDGFMEEKELKYEDTIGDL